LEREFYIRMTKKFGWTKNVLIHHVATYRIVKRLRRELKGQLPGPEEIARLLEDGG
jgi:hypothetical protein